MIKTLQCLLISSDHLRKVTTLVSKDDRIGNGSVNTISRQDVMFYPGGMPENYIPFPTLQQRHPCQGLPLDNVLQWLSRGTYQNLVSPLVDVPPCPLSGEARFVMPALYPATRSIGWPDTHFHFSRLLVGKRIPQHGYLIQRTDSFDSRSPERGWRDNIGSFIERLSRTRLTKSKYTSRAHVLSTTRRS